jgi:hypothetical protein
VIYIFLAAFEFGQWFLQRTQLSHLICPTQPAVILILTVYKKFKDYRDCETSIIKTLYRDGMVYILCIIGA